MKNIVKQIKKELGLQLKELRDQRRQDLDVVADDCHLTKYTMVQIEEGQNASWRYYYRLLRYYRCKIGIVPLIEDCLSH